MKRILFLTVLGAALVAFAVPASGAPGGATLVIRHQVRGCHAWSLNGGAYRATQHLALRKGASLLVVNNDVMPHQLVKTLGPAVTIKLIRVGGHMGVPLRGVGMMSHVGATTKVTFAQKGTYRLTTKAGEDYMEMGETVGPDNVLRAIVTVG